MAISNNIRKVLDLNHWEQCTTIPISSVASYNNPSVTVNVSDNWGIFLVEQDSLNSRYVYFLTTRDSIIELIMYDVEEDSCIILPFTESLAGQAMSFLHHPYGPSGVAVTGTVSSISTGLNLQSDFRGYKLRITEGPGAGEEREIAKNVVGDFTSTSGIVYVTEPFTEAITNQSKFQLYTGSIYYYIGYGNEMFKKIDLITNTITTLTTPNNYGNLTNNSFMYQSNLITAKNPFEIYVSANATSWSSNSITTSGKTWSDNNFGNYQLRILSGTGKGQIRTITSSISDTIYVSPNWSVTPSTDSQYCVEPNLDYIYFKCGGEVNTAFWMNNLKISRYDIKTNLFTTINTNYTNQLATTFANTSSIGTSLRFTVVDAKLISDLEGSTENNLTKNKFLYNGVFFNYLFKHNVSTSSVQYSNQIYPSSVLTINPDTIYNVTRPSNVDDWAYLDGKLYMSVFHGRYMPANAVIKLFEFDLTKNILKAINTFYMPRTGYWFNYTNNKVLFTYQYKEGNTKINYLYLIPYSSNLIYRTVLK